MSNKKKKNSNICVQTDFEQIQTTKDAHNSTDALACGEVEGNVFDVPDSVQLTVGDNEAKYVQNRTNPFLDDLNDSTVTLVARNSFLDDSDDSTVTIVGRNSFIAGATSNPLLLYEGETEEAPEIDSKSFEIDEPELIAIFQNSQNSFSLVDNPCPQDFVTNSFLITNPFELKDTNPFKGPIKENTYPVSGASEELEISVINTFVSQKQDGSSPVVSRPKEAEQIITL
ncbi:hypothetical protein AVEN_217626-1, partial [Araneus ventricosus]